MTAHDSFPVRCAAREAAAKLCGIAVAGQPGPAVASLLAELAAAFAPPAGGKDGAKRVGKFEERDGATAAAGYVLAQVMTGVDFRNCLQRCRWLPPVECLISWQFRRAGQGDGGGRTRAGAGDDELHDLRRCVDCRAALLASL